MATTLDEFIQHELEAQRQRITYLASQPIGEHHHDNLCQPQQPQ